MAGSEILFNKILKLFKWILAPAGAAVLGAVAIDQVADSLREAAKFPAEMKFIDYYAPRFQAAASTGLGLLTAGIEYIIHKYRSKDR